jgi:hypothetical protein
VNNSATMHLYLQGNGIIGIHVSFLHCWRKYIFMYLIWIGFNNLNKFDWKYMKVSVIQYINIIHSMFKYYIIRMMFGHNNNVIKYRQNGRRYLGQTQHATDLNIYSLTNNKNNYLCLCYIAVTKHSPKVQQLLVCAKMTNAHHCLWGKLKFQVKSEHFSYFLSNIAFTIVPPCYAI